MTAEIFRMPMLSILLWLALYLGFGVTAIAFMRLYVKWVVRPPQHSEFAKQLIEAAQMRQPDKWRKTARSMLFFSLAVLVWPLSIGIGINEVRKINKPDPERLPEEEFCCQTEHLTRPMSITDAEKLGVVTDPLGRAPALPFGHLNSAWLRFTSEQEDSFRLWYFEIPRKNPRVRYESSIRGFAWVKAHKIQAEFVFETY